MDKMDVQSIAAKLRLIIFIPPRMYLVVSILHGENANTLNHGARFARTTTQVNGEDPTLWYGVSAPREGVGAF
ncbi:hypothetical protein [Roseobacter denitrificans]|uniref:hypothetical protein n=1 Tax=Roseobacter denitrificans TaxID=2434 RepID=UPI001C0DA9D3|nr:hypothetical protein [Roseobacter denitrificans]